MFSNIMKAIKLKNLGSGSNYEEALKNARFKEADYLVNNDRIDKCIPDFISSVKFSDL